MFMFHIAVALGLIALTAGSALYVFSARCEGKGTCFATAIAVLVIIFSILSTACTLYCGVKLWQGGDGQHCLTCMKHGMQDKATDTETTGTKTEKISRR